MVIQTGESAVNIAGVLESYLQTPMIKLAADGTLSMPEVGRILPVLAGYQLHPALVVKATGPLNRLLLDLDVRTEAGALKGPLVTDLSSPDFAFAGPMHLERLNIGPILKNPAERSDISGDVRIDLTLPSDPSNVPAFERLGGNSRSVARASSPLDIKRLASRPGARSEARASRSRPRARLPTAVRRRRAAPSCCPRDGAR